MRIAFSKLGDRKLNQIDPISKEAEMPLRICRICRKEVEPGNNVCLKRPGPRIFRLFLVGGFFLQIATIPILLNHLDYCQKHVRNWDVSDSKSDPLVWLCSMPPIFFIGAVTLMLLQFQFQGASDRAVISGCVFIGGASFFALNLLTGVVPGGFIGGAIGGGLGVLVAIILNYWRKHEGHDCA